MRNPLFYFSFILSLNTIVYVASAQNFGISSTCNDNVNGVNYLDPHRDAVRAIFRMSIDNEGTLDNSTCTGTLINQRVQQGQLRTLFVTAWHCLSDADFNSLEHSFYFNFQSRDAISESVPENNQGFTVAQSGEPDPNAPLVIVEDGYQYFLESKVVLIERLRGAFGDIALCEMVEPIPPHFNVFYAGWQSRLPLNTVTSLAEMGPFVGIHHPLGDIKKGSRAFTINPLNNGVNTGCTIITTLIDAIIGWFGGRTRTEVICNFVDIPHFDVPNWVNGLTQGGSSGSPAMSRGSRILGALSGSPLVPLNIQPCGLIPDFDFYGKFKNFYNLKDVRLSLNPDNQVSANLFGIDGRQITCYESLLNLSGQYFPAEDYQDENHIELRANSDITTSGTLTVHNRADYEFLAGNRITLSPGFTARPGSTFRARIVPGCDANTFKKDPDNLDSNGFLPFQTIEIPEYKPFVLEDHIDVDKSELADASIAIYPNPGKGFYDIDIHFPDQQQAAIEVVNVIGHVVYQAQATLGQDGKYRMALDLTANSKGVYLVKVQHNNTIVTRKIIYR